MTTPGRVLVVDDHELFAHGLVLALQSVGVAAGRADLTSREHVLDQVRRDRPTLVLLDLDLGDPIGDGTDLVAPVTEVGCPVMIVTGNRELHRVGAALEQGAVDHATKDESIEVLVERIRAAAGTQGPRPDLARRYEALHSLAVHRAQLRERLAPLEALTPREETVLLALTHGLTATQIATREWVSENTVRSQIRGILSKLSVSNQVQAVALALRNGWAGDAGRV